MKLGPFRVDRQGLLSPADPARFPQFAVRWRDRVVQARMAQPVLEDHCRGILAVSTKVGRVPSTSGSSAHSRVALLRQMQLLPRRMPPGWQLRLTPDHCVTVETQIALALPISAVALVTHISFFLLSLSPYLDVLDADGIGLTAGSDRI